MKAKEERNYKEGRKAKEGKDGRGKGRKGKSRPTIIYKSRRL